MSDFVDPKDLKSGQVLLFFKQRLLKEATEKNWLSLLGCLRDSVVHVPYSAVIGETDTEGTKQCKAGDAYMSRDDIHLKPDTLKAPDDSLFLPVFSQEKIISGDYKAHFTVLPTEALQCLRMAHATDGVKGLVLDAFAEPLIIPFEIADIMESISSSLCPDGDEKTDNE